MVGTIISLFLVLYGGLAGPNLPSNFKKLFESKIFKIVILSLVAYSSTKDFKIAVMLAVAFNISVAIFDNRYLNECFTHLEKKKKEKEAR